jgi:signal transduction histidine kinase
MGSSGSGRADGQLLVADLRPNELFDGLSDDQYLWLSQAGSLRVLADGEVLFAEGEPATSFVVLLDGELVITKHVDGREEVLTRHSTRDDADQHDGKPSAAHRFTGEMPLLADDACMATATSVGVTRTALYSKEAFMEMLVRCPRVCQVLLPVLAWRIHASEAQAGQRQAINALGTLAAGLAHELNNPAAAVARASKELRQTLSDLEDEAEGWGGVALPEELAAMRAARADLVATPGVPGLLDALETADREEEIEDWLDDYDVRDASSLAGLLVERGLNADWLRKRTGALRPEAIGPALTYLSRSLLLHSLATDVSEAGERISAIVAATKEYTNVDRAPEQRVDLAHGIDVTLAMLRPKLSGITVHRDYQDGLPEIRGYPTELNQVWTNLIDNAVDALAGGGELRIALRREGACVVVEVADNGPGIAPEVLPRLFEPFFTTKDVGSGTGLGLHLSHRIVTQRHRGSIAVRSQPGLTRFVVRLPTDPAAEVACMVLPAAAQSPEEQRTSD